jgi:hypothetical protein
MVLLAIVAAIGAKYFSMRLKISKQERVIIECQLTSERLLEERGDLIDNVRKLNEAIMLLNKRGVEYERKLDELRATPPEKIIEYRDRIEVVDSVITSTDCEDAVWQGARVLRGEVDGD